MSDDGVGDVVFIMYYPDLHGTPRPHACIVLLDVPPPRRLHARPVLQPRPLGSRASHEASVRVDSAYRYGDGSRLWVCVMGLKWRTPGLFELMHTTALGDLAMAISFALGLRPRRYKLEKPTSLQFRSVAVLGA